MKIKYTLIIFFYLFVLKSGIAQEKYVKQLFFIAGDIQSDDEKKYKAELFYIKKDENILQRISSIKTENEIIRFLKIYHDYNIGLSILQETNSGKLKLLKFNLNQPFNLTYFDFGDLSKDFTLPLINPALVISPYFGFAITLVNNDINSTILKYIFFDLDKNEFKETSANVYSNPIYAGQEAGGLLITGLQSFKIKSADRKFYLPITVDHSKRPVLKFLRPEGVDLEMNDDATESIEINTEKIFLAKLKSSNVSGKNLGTSTYLINNKKDSSWFKIEFKTNCPAFRVFGKYLAGCPIEHYKYHPNKPDDFWYSPGKSLRKNGNTEYGQSFDFKAMGDLCFYPGQLFVYDTDLRKLLSWDTSQGDSEILLIDDGEIVYRVYNKLFSRKIEDGKLSTEKFLIQDDIIKDVHWAFYE